MGNDKVIPFMGQEEIDLDDFEAAYMPDTGHLSELIELCRGSRSKGDFAALIKINPPKYSRLNKGNITKQVDKELLKRIYDNQIEPGQVELVELLKAGGWCRIRKRVERPVERPMPTEEDERLRAKIDQERKDDENRVRAVNSIVRYALNARGQWCNHYDHGGFISRRRNPAFIDEMNNHKSRFGLNYPFSMSRGGFTLAVKDMEPLFWCFHPSASLQYGQNTDWSKLDPEKAEARKDRILRSIMADEGFETIFLKDVWEPDTLENIKSTIVFHDPVEFEKVWEVFGKKTVNNWISILLINIDKEKVVEERIMPRTDGKKKESLFLLPPTMEKIEDEDFDPEEDY